MPIRFRFRRFGVKFEWYLRNKDLLWWYSISNQKRDWELSDPNVKVQISISLIWTWALINLILLLQWFFIKYFKPLYCHISFQKNLFILLFSVWSFRLLLVFKTNIGTFWSLNERDEISSEGSCNQQFFFWRRNNWGAKKSEKR